MNLNHAFVCFQADIVFDEQDKGFWFGLNELRRQAKRPILITGNGNVYLLVRAVDLLGCCFVNLVL